MHEVHYKKEKKTDKINLALSKNETSKDKIDRIFLNLNVLLYCNYREFS